MLRALDQLDLTIGLSYVMLLTHRRRPDGQRKRARDPARAAAASRRHAAAGGSHTWVHGLPLKMRFKRSKIYVSAIPVWVIGFIIGFVGAIMGIGGGFLLVPMLIYFLRVPTATVIGTSMVLTLVTMASATVMHAATNHLVDAVLALILMVGGVIGAQFGARAGQKMRGERLRLLLGLLVLAVGLRFAFQLVVQPDDLYSIRVRGGGAMTRASPHSPLAVADLCRQRRPRPRRLVMSLSHHQRADHLELHRHRTRAVRHRRARRADRADAARDYDIVVTVTGPRQTLSHAPQGARARHLGQRRLADLRQRADLSRGAVEPAARRRSPTAENAAAACSSASTTSVLPQQIGADFADTVRDDPFRASLHPARRPSTASTARTPTA